MNRKGEVVVPPIWFSLDRFNEHGYALVRGEDPRVWGVLHKSGELVVEPVWNGIEEMDGEGHAVVKRGVQVGVVNDKGETLFLRKGHLEAYDKNGLALIAEEELPVIEQYLGWVDKHGEFVIQIPEGWNVVDDGDRGIAYSIYRETQRTGIRKWFSSVGAWISGDTADAECYECHTYDKEGNLIWSSTWLRETTKAWLYFSAALFTMLLVLWLGRKKKRMINEKS